MFQFIFYRTLHSQSAGSVTMANLCSLLRSHGYSVKMNLLDKKSDRIAETIRENASGHPVLLYKVNSMDYEKTFPILRELAQDKIFDQILLCGPFASLNAERILERYSWVDGVILGTGEYTMVKFAEEYRKHSGREKSILVEGGVWRDRATGEIIRKEVLHRIPLSEFPCPARDVERELQEKIANLEFSRGCANRCRYCHLRAYYEQYGLERERKTVDQVMEDLEQLYAMGKRYFVFNDSVFWNDERDTPGILELCSRIRFSGMKIFFMIYLSLYHFPPMNIIEKLKEVGLIRIFIGVESLDANVLHNIKEDAYPAFRLEAVREELSRHYISCHIGYIVFYPFSTLEQVKNSIEYLNTLQKVFRVGTILERLRLIPHTPMEAYVEGEGGDELDQAYDYRIADTRADRLQRELLDIFENRLGATYIQMELLCTACDLGTAILMREQNCMPEKVEYLYKLHQDHIMKCNQLLYRFFMDAVASAQRGEAVLLSEDFEMAYYEILRQLKESWTSLLGAMSEYTRFDLENMIPMEG